MHVSQQTRHTIIYKNEKNKEKSKTQLIQPKWEEKKSIYIKKNVSSLSKLILMGYSNQIINPYN